MTNKTTIADQLALERTRMSNERTLLAYVRTALALVGAGIASLELIDIGWGQILGAGFVVAGVLLLPVGIWRYIFIRRSLCD